MDNQEQVGNDLNEISLPEKTIDVNDGIKALLEENLAMTKEIKSMVRHINVYVAWQRIFGWLKVFIILIPVIIGIIYLPPIVEEAYRSFMKLVAGSITG